MKLIYRVPRFFLGEAAGLAGAGEVARVGVQRQPESAQIEEMPATTDEWFAGTIERAGSEWPA